MCIGLISLYVFIHILVAGKSYVGSFEETWNENNNNTSGMCVTVVDNKIIIKPTNAA